LFCNYSCANWATFLTFHSVTMNTEPFINSSETFYDKKHNLFCRLMQCSFIKYALPSVQDKIFNASLLWKYFLSGLNVWRNLHVYGYFIMNKWPNQKLQYDLRIFIEGLMIHLLKSLHTTIFYAPAIRRMVEGH